MPHLTKEQLHTAVGLLVGLAFLGGFFYWVSPGPMEKLHWPPIISEGLVFLFIFFWNVVVLPHGKSSKTLCLGSLFLLVGTYADFVDNIFIQPRWQDWAVQDLSVALGAGLFSLGLWYWDDEKEKLLQHLQKDRDFEKAVVPKLSHDLRIPLRNVRDAAERLEQDPQVAADAKSREALDTIQKALREVNLQLENIVEAHWLKSGSAKLRPTIFGIVQLFDETGAEFRYQADQRSVTIVRQCAGGEISIMADRLKVRRIIQNLLDNAIKFCAPRGKVTLDAAATASEITVRVIDEGPGISQDEMRRISQGSARTFGRGRDEDHESAGIGLSIVRDFVQLHGGRFWVEANSPSGAQFCIALPLHGVDKA